MVGLTRLGVLMISAYTLAIRSAREADLGIQDRLRGWIALKCEQGVTSLVSLSYVEKGDIAGVVVWSGTDPKGSIQMLAQHLNEVVGAGPELVEALANLYEKKAPGIGLLSSDPLASKCMEH